MVPTLSMKRAAAWEFTAAGLGTVIILLLWSTGVFQTQELHWLDQLFEHRQPRPAQGDVVVVKIGEYSLIDFGQWPWPRSIHADLIDHLTAAGAKAIGLDIVFEAESQPEEDEALVRAVRDSGRVILPVFLQSVQDAEGVSSVQGVYPLDSLVEAAQGKLAHISLLPDSDGPLRRFKPFIYDPVREAVIPSLSLAAACEFLGQEVPLKEAGKPGPLKTAAGRPPLFRDAQGDVLSNFVLDAEGKTFPMYEYSAVLGGLVPDEAFKDKLVLVGTTVYGIGEQFFHTPLPADARVPGIVVHAQAAETILHGTSIRRPEPWRYGIVLTLVCFAVGFLFIRLRAYDATYSVLGGTLLVGIGWLVAHRLFARDNYWFEFYPFVVLIGGALVGQLTWRLADAATLALRRRAQLDALQQVGDQVSLESDIDDDFQVALQSALAVGGTETGALWVLDEREEHYELALVRGVGTDQVQPQMAPADHGLLGDLARDRRPRVISHNVRGMEEGLSPLPPTFRSVVLMPLIARGHCVGALCVGKERANAFDPDQVQTLATIALQSGMDLDNARLVQRVQKMFVATIGALVRALEAKDSYTRGHSDRVTEYAILVARQMDLPSEYVEKVHLAGEVHDVGKIGMPDIVLNKPDKLTDDEYESFKSHAEWTGRILEGLDWLTEVREIAMHHHERWDGKGYPDGLKGDENPLGAQILAVTDAYDAMTSTRSYRKGMPQEKAVRIIVEETGTQLSPKVVAAFLRVPEAPWTEAAQAHLSRVAAGRSLEGSPGA